MGEEVTVAAVIADVLQDAREAEPGIGDHGHLRAVVQVDHAGVGVDVDELARDRHGPVPGRAALKPGPDGQHDLGLVECLGECGQVGERPHAQRMVFGNCATAVHRGEDGGAERLGKLLKLLFGLSREDPASGPDHHLRGFADKRGGAADGLA